MASERNIILADNYGNPLDRQCGFFAENVSMWMEDGGWVSHKKLRVLELVVISNYHIPKTFCEMFPCLEKLTITFGGKESLAHIQTLLTIVPGLKQLVTMTETESALDKIPKRQSVKIKVRNSIKPEDCAMHISPEELS